MSGADDLQHALPVQRLIQNGVDSIGGEAQRFLGIPGDSVDHQPAVGRRVPRGLQDSVCIRVIQAQHTGFKFLAVEERNRIALSGYNGNTKLLETVIQKCVTAGVNVDAEDPGSDLARYGCDGGTAHISLHSVIWKRKILS